MPGWPSKIYVIDDDASVCKAFVRFAKSAGYPAESFSSGESFLARRDLEPDAVVVSDIRMPGMDGPKIPVGLRDRGLTLPFIFITAVEDDSMIDEARTQGVTVLRKPVDGEVLLNAVARARPGTARNERRMLQ